MALYKTEDLTQRWSQLLSSAMAECTFTRELVGGSPSDEAGARAFVTHQMKLEGEEAEKTIRRILQEEIEIVPAPTEAPDLKEERVYGLAVIRRDAFGPWIGDWMIKACLKAAASRLGLFMAKRGTKGAVAEMGEVRASGPSAIVEYPERVHLVDSTGSAAETFYQDFKGRVQTPQGSMSIVSHRECAPAGSKVYFVFRWKKGGLSGDQVLDIFSVAQNLGFGSAKAYERGKFRVDSLEINA